MIHLANGTGATCSAYQDDLEPPGDARLPDHLLRGHEHGRGHQGITAFDTAIMMYPDLADNKLGSTGHSQGGQAAFTTSCSSPRPSGAAR